MIFCLHVSPHRAYFVINNEILLNLPNLQSNAYLKFAFLKVIIYNYCTLIKQKEIKNAWYRRKKDKRRAEQEKGK